jgi:hypothetical protein
MSASVVGATAWTLDPAYIANGAARTNSQGGGRGGYTFSDDNENALLTAPGLATWEGNRRRERGGLGGRPLTPSAATKLYFGGGGGSGDSNNQNQGVGGRGGGMVFVMAGTVAGPGSILANGEKGQDSISTDAVGPANGDAPGGGGGGGTVVVRATTLNNFTIHADGGVGGNQLISNNDEAEGPGGGGGGGYVALAGTQTTLTVTAAGAASGTTNAASMNEFPVNGATAGNTGVTNGDAAALSFCVVGPNTSFQTTEPNPTNDPTGEFAFLSSEVNSTFECRIGAAAFATCAQTFTTASLTDGTYTIEVRAVSPLGFKDPTPASFTWRVDTTPPQTSFVTTESNPTSDPTGDFKFGSNEALSTYQCRVDAGTFATCPEEFSTAALGEGSHTIEVRAVDQAGNTDPTPESYTWTYTDPADADNDGIPNGTERTLGTNPDDADSDDDGVKDGAEPSFGSDTDGDGLINALDPDSDNDGILDGTELGLTAPDAATNVSVGNFVPDADATTKTDPLKADTDGGTLADGKEDPNHNGKIDAGEKDPNVAADDVTTTPVDSDSDGLTDAEEGGLGTNPNDADTDDDGVLDGAEPNPSSDTDGDGLINPLDPDSDNDGIFDGTESGVKTKPAATDAGKGFFVPDADGAKTNPLKKDTDNGGVDDGAEDTNHNGAIDTGERDPNNAADDTSAPTDTDSDGLTDAEEGELGTNPNDADSDDDGVSDGNEPNPSADTDGDGLINPLDPDSDNDGLFDGTELGLGCTGAGTDPVKKHCTPDADSGATKTSPLDPDTDSGGKKDGSEDTNRDGKIDAGETDPTLGHGADDTTVVDTDGDGLSDGLETSIGTNPNDKDTDDDGLLDGEEPNPAEDSDGDGLINPRDVDSDNDGLFDGTESGKGCADAATDATKNHCRADADPLTTTGPLNPDTDGGTVRDGSEDHNLDGKLDAGETDPTLGHGADDTTVVDTDADGLSDKTETTLGTNPADKDSDDDGVLDGEEPNPGDDQDGDGKNNALDADSDGDGLFDGTEAGKGCADPATDATKNSCKADADSGTTKTLGLDPDTDDGGVKDGDEDLNKDGKVDDAETNPLDKSDDKPVTGAGGAGGGAGTAGSNAGGTTSSGGSAGLGGTTATGGTAGAAGRPGTAGTGGTDSGTVVLGGGICSVSAPASPASQSAALLLLAAGAACLARRRKRRA